MMEETLMKRASTRSPFRSSMHFIAHGLLLAMMILSVSGCVEQRDAEPSSDPLTPDLDTVTTQQPVASGSLYDVLREEGRFSRFVALVDAAGLGQTLSGPGPYTHLAPTTDAVQARQTRLDAMQQTEDPNELRGVLLYHIVMGETHTQDLSDGSTVRTLEGSTLSITGTGDSLAVGPARVIESDLEAANGVIHVVDRLLTPDMNPDGI